jgi:hypothetical protein
MFLLPEASRPTTGPTKPPVRSRPRDLCQGENGQDVNITTHIHLAQRSRKGGSASLLNSILSFRGTYARAGTCVDVDCLIVCGRFLDGRTCDIVVPRGFIRFDHCVDCKRTNVM